MTENKVPFTIPDGYEAISGERFPEIIHPLLQAAKKNRNRANRLGLTPQQEIDEVVDIVAKSGDLRHFGSLSDKARSLLSEKIANLTAQAAQSLIDEQPFMISKPSLSDGHLLASLILQHIRSPKTSH